MKNKIIFTKFTIAILIAFTLSSTLKAQKTISGVTLPRKVMSGKTTLNLNGGGIREKLWIDLYVAGLYVKVKSNDANQIINSDERMSMRIQIVSSLITSEKMSDAIEDGFRKSTNKNTKKLRERIDAFKAVFLAKELKDGDIFDIVYVPGTGVVIYTKKKIAAKIKGLDFKKALFGIWLGKKPVDNNLKKDLLEL